MVAKELESGPCIRASFFREVFDDFRWDALR